MAIRWDPYRPQGWEQARLLQPLTGEHKVPVWEQDGAVIKGPYLQGVRHWVTTRYESLVRAGVYQPDSKWQALPYGRDGAYSASYWVSTYLPQLYNPFAATEPLSVIRDDPKWIADLVRTGVAKQVVGCGDLCTRNMPYDLASNRWVALDLEDRNHSPTDFATCALSELCFAPIRRLQRAKRERLEALIRKHVRACIQAVWGLYSVMDPKHQGAITRVTERLVAELPGLPPGPTVSDFMEEAEAEQSQL
jgi:hypothetical protein